MNFLNGILLFGAFALTLPIIIHLFHKSRFEIVRWGAMHLLETVIRTNQRRFQIEQWILLALRASLPLLLALLMARPVWQGAQSLLGDARTSTVILLDNSYSMQAGRAGISTFSLARDAATHLVGGLRRGSEVQVLLMGAGGSTLLDQPTIDPDRAIDAINQLTADYGAATVPYALGFAAGILESMHESARHVVVVSDFQKVSFDPAEDAALGQALERLRKAPVPPNITFFDVGQDVRDNVAVESLDFSRLMVGVGQKMQIRGNLRNYGDVPYPDLRVYFKVDGKEKAISQINLAPHQHTQVLFTHAFETTGSHFVEIYAEGDPLKADNSALASFTVRDKLPVLLVDGDPSTEPLKSETAFAEIALQPYGASRSQVADLITTQVIRPEALSADALAKSSMVMLANVRKLDDRQLHALEDFVKQGGGLFIAPGNRIEAAWYNSAFLQEGRGLLPGTVGELAGDPQPNGPTTSIAAERFENPALEIFNDPKNGSLSEAAIRMWYKLKPANGATTLARLDSGDPFLLEKPFGEGRVILAATAIDADWGNLPMRSFYLPFLQRLSVYLASTIFPPHNLEVGHSISAFLPVADAGKKAILTLPNGGVVELPITKKGTRGVVEYSRTQEPGLYLLQAPGGEPVHYVVNASRIESDLQKLSETEMTAFAQRHNVTIVHNDAEYQQNEHLRRYGREIWKPILWLLLLLSFAELILQQRFAGIRRRTAA